MNSALAFLRRQTSHFLPRTPGAMRSTRPSPVSCNDALFFFPSSPISTSVSTSASAISFASPLSAVGTISEKSHAGNVDGKGDTSARGVGNRDGDNGSDDDGGEDRHRSSGHRHADPGEVLKFSSLAPTWWDSRSNPLVGMNPVRMKFLLRTLERCGTLAGGRIGGAHSAQSRNLQPERRQRSSLEGMRCLDVGCGGGLLAESLGRLGASSVHGIDASPRVTEAAGIHAHGNGLLRGVRYEGGVTVEDLSERMRTNGSGGSNEEGGLFDVITTLEVIEHVRDPISLLRAAVALLKPGGFLFVSTINRTAKSYALAIVAAEYLSGKVPVGTHDWETFRSPLEVRELIRQASEDEGGEEEVATRWAMREIAVSGMVIQPPFFDMRWTLDKRDTDVNWIGAYQKVKQEF